MAGVYPPTETLAVGSARQRAAFSILERSKALPTLHTGSPYFWTPTISGCARQRSARHLATDSIRGEGLMKYTIAIQWSDRDNCFVVFLPDFEDVMQPVTYGDTYTEALQNAQDVLELLVESALEEGKPLPAPKQIFQAA